MSASGESKESVVALRILEEVPAFIAYTLTYLSSVGITVSTSMEIDHVCYRCSSIEEYAIVKASFCTIGTCLVESIIGGRPIATVLLSNPILFRGFIIRNVEIPAPKSGRPYASGLEHCEIVLTPNARAEHVDVADILLNRSKPLLEKFVAAHSVSSHSLKFNLSAMKKELNEDVSLYFPAQKQTGEESEAQYCVKFHAMPLDRVIAYEISAGSVARVPEEFTRLCAQVIAKQGEKKV
jgi:uncharacterized protein